MKIREKLIKTIAEQSKLKDFKKTNPQQPGNINTENVYEISYTNIEPPLSWAYFRSLLFSNQW